MERRTFLSRAAFWTNFIFVVFLGFFGATIVSGWTNPSGDPPTSSGAISASGGNVSINGVLDMLTHRLTGVAAPTDSSDATNKAYVDAQVGGGGSKQPGTIVTLFGVAAYDGITTGVVGTSLFRGPNGGVPPACRNLGSFCGTTVGSWGLGWNQTSQSGATLPSAGTGTPSCSTLSSNLSSASSTARKGDWLEIFAGYGPHETVVEYYTASGGGVPPTDPNSWTIDAGTSQGQTTGDQQEDDISSSAVSVSDSVCSNSAFENVSVVRTSLGTTRSISINSGYNSACSTVGCNTCRVCQWAPY